MTSGRRFRNCNEFDIIRGSQMVSVNFNINAVVGLGYLRGDFTTSEIHERVREDGKTPTRAKVNAHVWGELGTELNANVGFRVETLSCARQEQSKEFNCLTRRSTENAVDQNTPSIQIPHIHEGGEGGRAENCIRNGSSNETGELPFNRIETKDFAGEISRF